MIDWQSVVRSIGRSRSDFIISEWDDLLTNCKVIRLTCNCCGHWAQQSVNEEFLVNSYSTDFVFVDVIERLTRFMLEVRTDSLPTLPATYVKSLPS